MTDCNTADFEKRDDVIRITDNFYSIKGPDDARFPYCNCFLLTGDETVLIDSGIGPEKIKDIDAIIHIDILILSHTHADHFWGWPLLEDRRILVPRQTPACTRDLQLLGERFMGSHDGGRYWVKLIETVCPTQALREPDECFDDGDIIRYGGADLQAIHAPGHLEDHYCFFDLKSRVLLTTDISLSSFGPVYPHEECDIALFKQSIKKIMALPYKIVCSSHKPPVVGNAEEMFLSFLQGFERHEQEVLKVCTLPRTLEEIVAASPIYKNQYDDKVVQNAFEIPMVKKNLDILIRDGRVEVSGDKYSGVSETRRY